jgi:hypothetical protein
MVFLYETSAFYPDTTEVFVMVRRLLIRFAFVAALLAPAVAMAQPMTVDEVVKLLKNDISDNIIVARIEETGSYFSLSTDDLIKLKEAGASDELVRYMIMRKPGGEPPAAPGEVEVNVTGRVSVRGLRRRRAGILQRPVDKHRVLYYA